MLHQSINHKIVFVICLSVLVASVFLNDKKVLTSDIAWDLIHLSEKGYKIWAEAMESTIVKLMGENKI
jgi:lysophospholipase L1-like esterase